MSSLVHKPLLLLLSSVLLGLSAERSFAAAPRISFTEKTRQMAIQLISGDHLIKADEAHIVPARNCF